MVSPACYEMSQCNVGPWAAAYTLNHLKERSEEADFVLPIASIGQALAVPQSSTGLLLPPLYREAMTQSLREEICERIEFCFPVYGHPEENRKRLHVIELAAERSVSPVPGKLIAFSVDTAIEEHGPHLPLSTDTIQSYGVLSELAGRASDLSIVNPLDYGQLTWGLPFGFSVDIGADLLTRYVTGYVNALQELYSPAGFYVVDVHGSIVHRTAIVRGLTRSNAAAWKFRWLHEPLAEFGSARGDQHAGGVETALVEYIAPEMMDTTWWPNRIDDLAASQMTLEQAVSLSSDLDKFTGHVQAHDCNGIVGDVKNYHSLNAGQMFTRMVDTAMNDLEMLKTGHPGSSDDAGSDLW